MTAFERIEIRARTGDTGARPRLEATWANVRLGIELGAVGGFIATTAGHPSNESTILLGLYVILRAMATFVAD